MFCAQKDDNYGFIDINGRSTFDFQEYLKAPQKEAVSTPNKDDTENLNWLQGHWVYEQGNYKGHFIIQGNKLSMYSTMNPDPLTYTYRVEGNELYAGEMTVKLDLTDHRIDYGDGNWMHKIN